MKIIINADDFGWDRSCTDAVIESFHRGLITTATAMCNGECFDYAVGQIKKTPYHDRVGIHFVLTQGMPLTEEIKNDPFFCNTDGRFHGNFNRMKPISAYRKKLIYGELCAQADRFSASGLNFHHADSHHHIHTAPIISPIVCRVVKEYSISKLRIHRNVGQFSAAKRLFKAGNNAKLRIRQLAYTDLFCGYGELQYLSHCAADKILEIMCHPDFTFSGELIDRKGYRLETKEPFGDLLEPLFQKTGLSPADTGCFVPLTR